MTWALTHGHVHWREIVLDFKVPLWIQIVPILRYSGLKVFANLCPLSWTFISWISFIGVCHFYTPKGCLSWGSQTLPLPCLPSPYSITSYTFLPAQLQPSWAMQKQTDLREVRRKRSSAELSFCCEDQTPCPLLKEHGRYFTSESQA